MADPSEPTVPDPVSPSPGGPRPGKAGQDVDVLLSRLADYIEGQSGGEGAEAPRVPSSLRGAGTKDVLARLAQFSQLNPDAAPAASQPLHFLSDVSVTLTVELGRTTLPLGEVLKLGAGSVLPLDRLLSEPVDISARGVLLARGEVVVVEDRFAIRVKEILQPKTRTGGPGG